MENHMNTLEATKPLDTNSPVSTPVGEACQWAFAEIKRLRALGGVA